MLKQTKTVLAFDFGASSGRAMLGTLKNGRLEAREIHRFSNDPVTVGGVMYWDALRLFYEIKTGISKAVLEGGFDAIGIDTWGVDFGLIDENGELLGNPVHYRDKRTDSIPDEVFAHIPSDEIYARTGIQTLHFNTVYQLYYLAKYRSDMLARTRYALLIPDLFAYWLTGVPRAEATVASTTNMVNPVTRQWDEELLSRLGIPTSILPEMIDPCGVYGELSDSICDELGCKKVPVIAVCTHDTASAVLSAPEPDGKICYISCGTWSLFGTELSSPLISEAGRAANYTNEGGFGGTTRFLRNIMGLWLIQESRRQWRREGAEYSFADLEKAALAATPFQCFIDCDSPEFEKSGDIPGRVQQFCRRTGQHVPQNVGEIMRCIYESLAMKYRANLDLLEAITGEHFDRINMLGGGIKDTLLCKMTASSTGRTVAAGPVEATVTGNIAVQMIALGEIESMKEARRVISESCGKSVYAPENHADWDSRFADFSRIIKK